jgi:ribosomal protein S18 acetylase RimI-like enzyme
MGLAPGAQGQGLGTQLLQLTLERVRAENRALQLKAKAEASSGGHQGIEIVYLMVREDNRPAISLYRKVGFEQVAVLHKDTKISNNLYYDGIMMRLFM